MNILLLALVPACFALNPVIGRAMADVFGPASLSVVRWSGSALVIALLARGEIGARRAPLGVTARLAGLGILGMGFCAYAAFIGAHTSTATNVSLIYGCTPAFVAVWEISSGRQRAKASLALGIAGCLLGVVLILTQGHLEALRNMRFVPGDLWAAAGMFAFVVYTVAMRRVSSGLGPLSQFTLMASAATLALAPVAALEVAADGWPALQMRALPWIAALVLATGIGAYLGYNVSLKRNGPVLTSASIALTPMYAAMLAVVLIGERLAWYHGVALVLVVCGLMLINRGQAAPPAAAPATAAGSPRAGNSSAT
ncbi:MAG TPA: DMT family transporter [Hyphomicrobiaceae bacterium]|nr:DMT family transporter [Hyphomicrobiaceae bacterium]